MQSDDRTDDEFDCIRTRGLCILSAGMVQLCFASINHVRRRYEAVQDRFCQIVDGCAVEWNRKEKHCACFHSAFLISSIMLYFFSGSVNVFSRRADRTNRFCGTSLKARYVVSKVPAFSSTTNWILALTGTSWYVQSPVNSTTSCWSSLLKYFRLLAV